MLYLPLPKSMSMEHFLFCHASLILHSFILYIYDTWTGIATLFIMCNKRTATLYDALWDKIMQLTPQLEENVKFIMSDFEIAAVKSLSQKFPRAKLSGCWFHFNQAVLRKWRKLRLSNVPRTVLSMTMALPLLPSNMFEEALHIIQAEADLLSDEYPDILHFTSYLRLTWSNMASKISTFDCPVRTNNIVESFHNIAVQKLGTRNINVWTFLEKLKKLMVDQELDFRRLKNGVRARRTRTRASRERDIKIRNMQENLVNKRLPLKQFLLMFTTDNNIFEIEQLASFDEDELSSNVQIANMEFFSDNLNETFETNTQIGSRNTRRRRSQREPNIPLSSQREEENEANAYDSFIYEAPEDDYGYLYENDNSTDREDLPFHTVNWNFQNPNVSRAKSSEENCTVCFVNERTHVFIPCGHLACCIECIEKLESNRCPICNVTYENSFRVRKP